MEPQAGQRQYGRGAEAALWASWALGPLGWALHQSTSYAVVTWDCQAVSYPALHLATGAALAFAALGAWLGWRGMRVRRGVVAPSRQVRRQRFMAGAGLGICLFSLAGIVAESLPVFVLIACDKAA